MFLRDFQRFEFRNKTICVTTLISGKERRSPTEIKLSESKLLRENSCSARQKDKNWRNRTQGVQLTVYISVTTPPLRDNGISLV